MEKVNRETYREIPNVEIRKVQTRTNVDNKNNNSKEIRNEEPTQNENTNRTPFLGHGHASQTLDMLARLLTGTPLRYQATNTPPQTVQQYVVNLRI